MMPDLPTLKLERSFDAPPELVWRGWTEAGLLSRWYGGGGGAAIRHLDARSGGHAEIEMSWGGQSQYQRFEFLEVERASRLVFVIVSTDSAGQPAPAPHAPDWPTRLLTTVTLVPAGKGTLQKLTWAPHDATAREIVAFEAALPMLGRGWGSGFEALAKLLASLPG
jgi:uncharacterized protein YndB with AHSA1/START domain